MAYLKSVPALAAVPAGPQGRLALIIGLENGLMEWLNHSQPPTLGQLLAEDKLASGTIFTHYGPFYGKGVMDAAAGFAAAKPLAAEARIRAKFDSFRTGCTLDIQIHPENYTTISSSSELSGHKRLFVVGRLTEHRPPLLRAQAYAIGHFHNEFRPNMSQPDPLEYLPSQMEIFANQIDNFSAAKEVDAVSKAELARLRDVSEAEIKEAFGRLAHEPYIPVDWGGERSDLVSTAVCLNGKRYVTAFAFKGPAKFKPLTVADLGKNGDQISRLFSEPADLVVLQHCHAVTSAVRDHMRAFATRIGQLRPFCIIDGAETVRILRAYNQLGF